MLYQLPNGNVITEMQKIFMDIQGDPALALKVALLARDNFNITFNMIK